MHIAVRAKRSCHPAGESREGAALFAGGLGTPPNPHMLHFARGNRARPASRQGRAHGHARLRNRDQRDGRARGPAGESREGAALFGGGLGEPPTPIRSAYRQGSGRTSEAGTGAPRTRVGAPLRIWESGPWGRSEVSDPAGESREGTALFGGGLGGTPKPLSAPLPVREAGRPPEWGGSHSHINRGHPEPLIPSLSRDSARPPRRAGGQYGSKRRSTPASPLAAGNAVRLEARQSVWNGKR